MIRMALITIILANTSLTASAAGGEFCLNSVTQDGNTVVSPDCSDDIDPLHLSENPDIIAAISLLGIDKKSIDFKGCQNLAFMVKPITDGTTTQFKVHYDSTTNKDLVIAPTLHELSHIVQIQEEGSYENLVRAYPSKERIELGADYLTGIIFRKLFPQKKLKEFEQNINLAGLYIEKEDPHGNPSRRTQAFRLGVNGETDASNDIRKNHLFFQREIYGEIR